MLVYTVKQNMLFNRRLYKAHCEGSTAPLSCLHGFVFILKVQEIVTNKNKMRAAAPTNQEFHLQLSGGSQLAFELHNCV